MVIAYTGAVAPEAIQATGFIAEDRRDVGLLAVTSADRLNAGWAAAMRARERGLVHARSHIERLFAELPPHCGIVTVLDGHPATLAWLGAVSGHRVRPLGVEHFGQTGTIAELYRHYGIDANAIIAGRAGDHARHADPASAGAVMRRDLEGRQLVSARRGPDGIERVADDAAERGQLIGFAQHGEFRLALEDFRVAGCQHDRNLRIAFGDLARRAPSRRCGPAIRRR